MRIHLLFIALAVTGCLLVAGCTQSPVQKQGPPITPPATPIQATATISSNGPDQPVGVQTTQDLIAFVDKAVVYARENGKEKAIAAFNDPDGAFTRDGLYIFAEGLDGTALAEPFEHEIVGKNILDLNDPYGIPIVRNLADTARNGKGLVSYNYRNPSKNYTIQPKVSYVVNVDGTYYIGAGLYENKGTEFPASGMNVTAKDTTPGELVTFVMGARDYAKKNGKEKALAAFTDPNRESPVSKGVIPGRAGNRNAPTAMYASFSPSWFNSARSRCQVGSTA